MIHPILLYGNDVLKQKSEDLPKSFSKLNELIDDMFETMHKSNGIGLSAIQIGIPLNIFVIEVHIIEEDFHFRNVFINPIIKKEYGPFIKYSEACLSLPMIHAMVQRRAEIELEYYDENWNLHVENFNGYKSRIIQHEYDHLQGILYIDRIDYFWKKILEKPLEEIKERKINTKYGSK